MAFRCIVGLIIFHLESVGAEFDHVVAYRAWKLRLGAKRKASTGMYTRQRRVHVVPHWIQEEHMLCICTAAVAK